MTCSAKGNFMARTWMATIGQCAHLRYGTRQFIVKSKHLDNHMKTHMKLSNFTAENVTERMNTILNRRSIDEVFVHFDETLDYLKLMTANRLCLSRKPYVAAENFLFPWGKDLLKALKCDPPIIDAVAKSAKTMKTSTVQIQYHLKEKLVREIKSSPFPVHIQVDDSTDITKQCNVVLHVYFMHKNGNTFDVVDDYLFGKALLATGNSLAVKLIVKCSVHKTDANLRLAHRWLYLLLCRQLLTSDENLSQFSVSIFAHVELNTSLFCVCACAWSEVKRYESRETVPQKKVGPRLPEEWIRQ